MSAFPPEIEEDIRRAIRLEWWTIAWQISIVALLFVVMGSSQAMKSAWFEDLAGLLPAAVFLVSIRFERKPPDARFPRGYHRVNSLAFLASACVLAGLGLYLAFGSIRSLIAGEHPIIGPVTVMGETFWIGWAMIAALAYSVVPPVVLGRKKQPVARRIQDKVVHTDALMQKADWMTGLAAIVGILGVGFGLWWADAVAALVIAADIVRDGFRAAGAAVAELADGMPRGLGTQKASDEAKALRDHLSARFPSGDVRLRESGRYIVADLRNVPHPPRDADPRDYWPGRPDRAWRLSEIGFSSDGRADDEG